MRASDGGALDCYNAAQMVQREGQGAASKGWPGTLASAPVAVGLRPIDLATGHALGAL